MGKEDDSSLTGDAKSDWRDKAVRPLFRATSPVLMAGKYRRTAGESLKAESCYENRTKCDRNSASPLMAYHRCLLGQTHICRVTTARGI
jgi:hypothetical protein